MHVTLYEHGKGAGKPQTTFKGRVTREQRRGEGAVVSRSYNVEVEGRQGRGRRAGVARSAGVQVGCANFGSAN